MPQITLTNAAHTAIRRSLIRDHQIWSNGWSTRIPGTTNWVAELSDLTVSELLYFQLPHETLSETIVRIFAIRDRNRRHHSNGQ